MTLYRRDFFGQISVSALGIQRFASGAAGSRGRIQAIAFDAFPILDPRPVFALVNELYPRKGVELGNLWRTKQFEYTWLRTLAGRYSDFCQVTNDALVFATKSLKVDLTPDNHDRLMGAYLQLRCWPDVPAALRSLKSDGMRLAFLSNMTPKMLEAGIRNSDLNSTFDHVLSTDRVKAYKPDPRAYRMALESFGLKAEQILFVAFAGWDVAGAKSFGYPTFWVNRQKQPAEELSVVANASGDSLSDLINFLRNR